MLGKEVRSFIQQCNTLSGHSYSEIHRPYGVLFYPSVNEVQPEVVMGRLTGRVAVTYLASESLI